MGPKKNAPKPGAEVVEGEDPIQLLQNYQKFCKLIGLPIHGKIPKTLNDEEKYPIEQLIVDDEFGPLGPGGTRALMTAIMGSGPSMKGGPYKLLNSIRIWRSNIGDDGASSVAEVLRLGGADVKISYLELLDNNIGARGALALGTALSRRHNLSLLTLKLDYNSTLGTEGIVELCKGLRTNCTLKQLHISYCGITSDGGEALADLLANTRSNLEVLNVNGNSLGGVGLYGLCKGLAVNSKLQKLLLADNQIDQAEEDLAGLESFRDCLTISTLELTSIDLMWNRIGEVGANILIPALEANTKITEFLVDLTLPMELFEKLFRRDSGKKGKKKGKKGKKK